MKYIVKNYSDRILLACLCIFLLFACWPCFSLTKCDFDVKYSFCCFSGYSSRSYFSLKKNVIFMSNVFLLHFCFWHFQIIFFIIVNLFTKLDLQNKSEIIIFLSHWPWTQTIHDHRITLYFIINCLPKQCFFDTVYSYIFNVLFGCQNYHWNPFDCNDTVFYI
jgi:hypothetical protein